MRKTLIDYLLKTDHSDRWFLTADVGFGLLEPLEEMMGDRFINVGIAEQSMVGIAAGLALSGKEVWTYTMCTFYLRALEQIRNDICYQGVPVRMIGVGIEYDYEHLGTTHFAIDDFDIMSGLRNIDIVTPNDTIELNQVLHEKNSGPQYIRISRFHENQYAPRPRIFNQNKYPHYVGDINYMKQHDGSKTKKSLKK